MVFKIGDKVTIISIDEEKYREVDAPGYNESMMKTIGKTGTISGISNDFYSVEFSSNNARWWYCSESFELLKEESNSESDYYEKKQDKGKLMWHLLPWDAIEKIVEVMDQAVRSGKYKEGSWKTVEPFRYKDAMIRHHAKIETGEKVDVDSKLLHSAHRACNALFLLWNDIQEKEGKE